MTSIYACALSLGAPARVALALHGAVAVAVVAATAATAHRLGSGAPGAAEPRVTDPRAAAGVTLMATAFVSPYFFDYDLAVFGLGLALALPGLALRLSMRRLAGLLMAVCAAGGVEYVFVIVVALDERLRLSLGGPLLLACFAVMLATLREPAQPPPRREGIGRHRSSVKSSTVSVRLTGSAARCGQAGTLADAAGGADRGGGGIAQVEAPGIDQPFSVFQFAAHADGEFRVLLGVADGGPGHGAGQGEVALAVGGLDDLGHQPAGGRGSPQWMFQRGQAPPDRAKGKVGAGRTASTRCRPDPPAP